MKTNCFWATDDKITEKRLRTLREKGLKGILISVNPFILEFVPFERTEGAIKMARKIFTGDVMIYQEDFFEFYRKLGIKGRMTFEEFRKSSEGQILTANTEILMMGRVVYKLSHLYQKYPSRCLYSQPCTPSFLRSLHNHFDLYGNVVSGYCGGISLGNIREAYRKE